MAIKFGMKSGGRTPTKIKPGKFNRGFPKIRNIAGKAITGRKGR